MSQQPHQTQWRVCSPTRCVTVHRMYFTIRRAGLLRNRYRARLYGANNELVWYTQTYTSKIHAREACHLIDPHDSITVHDQT